MRSRPPHSITRLVGAGLAPSLDPQGWAPRRRRPPASRVRDTPLALFLGVGIALLIAVATLAPAPARAELRAGAAKADITPPVGGRLYGYGARGDAVSTGVHDPLFAKVLVLDDGATAVAFVTLDLGSIRKEQTRRVRERVRAAAGFDQVLLLASHSHSTPTFDEPFYATWLGELEERIAGAVIEAHGRLAPARLGFGRGRAEEGHNRRKVSADGTVEMFWRNRERLPTSPVDYELGVLAVDSIGGAPIATLVNFACHPVVLGPENLELSADYPGAMNGVIEERVGGVSLFMQGAAGDINPFWDKTPPAEGGFEQAAIMGQRLAEEALRVRAALEWALPDSLSIRRGTVPLELRWDFERPEVVAVFEKLGTLERLELYRERFRREREAEVTTVVIGHRDRSRVLAAIATFPGEFFVEHGLRLKRTSLLPNTLFAGYGNGELGYFPTLRAAAEGGYGGREATIVEVGAGEKLVDRALINLHYQTGWLQEVPSF